MNKEIYYQNKWNDSSLINNTIYNELDTIEPWLKKAICSDGYKNRWKEGNKIYNNTPCKEGICVHKSGYCNMQVILDGETKYFTKHRIAYWEKTGTYPQLVRHLCDNPRCYNPEHLEEGTYRDNALDKRGDFPKEFEDKWIEFNGDVKLITEHFGWKPSCFIGGIGVSANVYEWERKLGIKQKYPDIIKNNKNRRVGPNRVV